MENLIYSIGEILITEIEEIQDINYPKVENPTFMDIRFKDGMRVELSIKEIKSVSYC